MTSTAFLISQVQDGLSFQKWPIQQLSLTCQPEPTNFLIWQAALLYLTNITFYHLILTEHRLNKSWLYFEFIAANDFELQGLLTLNGYISKHAKLPQEVEGTLKEETALIYAKKPGHQWMLLDCSLQCQVSGPDKHISHLQYLSSANINPAKLAPSNSHSICPCRNKHWKEKSLSRNYPA